MYRIFCINQYHRWFDKAFQPIPTSQPAVTRRASTVDNSARSWRSQHNIVTCGFPLYTKNKGYNCLNLNLFLLDLRTKFQQRYADMPGRIAQNSWLSWRIQKDSNRWSLNLTGTAKPKDKSSFSQKSDLLTSYQPNLPITIHDHMPLHHVHTLHCQTAKAWNACFCWPRYGSQDVYGKFLGFQATCFLIVDNERYQPPWNRKNFQHLYIKYTSVLLRLVSGVPPTTATGSRIIPAMPLRTASELHLLRSLCITEGSQKPHSLQGSQRRIAWCHRKNTPTTAPVEDNMHHSTSTCF